LAEPITSELPAATIEVLTSAFGVPEFLLPWIDRFLDPLEIELVVALATGPLTLPEAAARLSEMVAPAFFERAWRRAIINRPTDEMLSLAAFSDRLEIWALFEGWKDLPEEVRDRVRAWDLQRYVEEKREQIEELKDGGPPPVGLENAEYLLLPEAERLLARAEHIYLWPCDCRAIMNKCSKPLNVCLRFDNDRGLGWEISYERALEIVRDADRHGLMHTAEITPAQLGDAPLTAGALCNCCADCCYPHQAAEQLGVAKLWPHTRYVARLEASACDGCGRCLHRCPFGAITRTAESTAVPGASSVTIDSNVCHGCGLCASGCTRTAITMEPLDQAM